MEPTPERIVEDIMSLPDAVAAIKVADGCVVNSICSRTGRRWESMQEFKPVIKHKPIKRQRKSTITKRPTHPDATEGYNSIFYNIDDVYVDVPVDED